MVENRPAGNSLTRAGLAGPCCFTAALFLMHFVQPDLSAKDDAVSYYMDGRFGWVLGVGLVSLGAGSLASPLGIVVFGGLGNRSRHRWNFPA